MIQNRSRVRAVRIPVRWLAAVAAVTVSPAAADIDFASRTGSGPIKAAHSGLCLTVPGASTTNGVQIEQQPCNGSAAQTWQAKPSGNGTAFVNQATGQCLDSMASYTQGNAVIQSTCNGAAQQTWAASAQGGGYGLKTAYSGQCADIFGVSTASGAKLIQWGCSGSTNQTFIAGVSTTGGGTTTGSTTSVTVTLTPTLANGWYAKEMFLFARNASGAITNQTVVLSYNFGATPAGMNTPSAPFSVPAGSTWGIGMRVWQNGDKSRNGTPALYYSDTNGQTVMTISGNCTTGIRQDAWGDAGTKGSNILYNLACPSASGATGGTGTGGIGDTGTSAGTGTGGTGTGTTAGTTPSGGTAPSSGSGSATGVTVTMTPTLANGWYAKEMFLFARNASGAITNQTVVLSYNFGATPAGMNTPSAPFSVPAGSTWGIGMRVWQNGDKSRNGTPALYYSDTNGQTVMTISGNCTTGIRQDAWGDAGTKGSNILYNLACPGATGGTGTGGTGTSAGGTNTGGTGTGVTGTGTGVTPPGEVAPSSASILINRRSGNCLDGANNGVAQQICRDLGSQDWTFVPTANGYQIKSAATGQCLAVQNAGTGNGTTVVQQGCSTEANALFRLRKLDKWLEIVATHSNKCISPSGGGDGRDSGRGMVQWECDMADPQRWTVLGAEGRANSAWTAPRMIGIVPVAGTVLPNGKVLFWAAEQRDNFSSGTNTWTTLYDPSTDQTTDTNVTGTGSDMFCPGTNILPDGRILVTGGITAGNATLYDPSTNAWSRVANMKITRGYNASTTLSTGESFTYGGSWSGGAGGKDAEIWSSSTNQWRILKNVKGNDAADPSVAIYPGDTHYWLFAGPNGSVFHAGPSTRMHWITTSGDGSLRDVGARGTDVFAVNGTATMYDVGKIFKAGGAPAYTGVPALDTAYTIDISAGPNANPTVAEAAPMLFPRAYMNSVVLPDGDVISAGGQIVAAQFTDNLPVMMPEIWSPKTGKVRRLAPMAVPRNYHSIGMLLLDGRVLFGGGGLCGGCGGANHLNFEIMTPPYLYDAQGKLASRPSIQQTSSASYGGTLTVTTDRAVSSFSMVRLSAVTHSTNNDQRRVPLVISSTSGTTYQLAIPSDPAVLLAGNWMLFAMDANGVPSIAKVIRIR